MGVLRRYRLLILIYAAAVCASVLEIAGRTWTRNPYADARNLPPEADASVALWPDEPESDYVHSVEAVQLRFDLSEARAHLERARARGTPVEERILHEYVHVLVLMHAEPSEVEAAAREWRRHYPDSKRSNPLLSTNEEFPARQQAGSLWNSVLSPNGRLLVTIGRSGTIVVADVIVGREQRYSDTRPDRAELPLGVNRDSTLLATADKDHAVTIWDLAAMRPQVRLPGHSDRVYGIAFAGDGRHLATGSRDQTVRVWDVTTGQPVRIFSGLKRPVSALAFSPDGRTLATGNWSGDVALWEWREESPPRMLTGHRGVITALTFAPHGGALSLASRDSTVRLWKLADASYVTVEHRAAVACTTFLPRGGVLATGGSDYAVQFWDAAAGTPLHTMQVAGRVFGMGYSAEGNSLGVATFANERTNVVHYALP